MSGLNFNVIVREELTEDVGMRNPLNIFASIVKFCLDSVT